VVQPSKDFLEQITIISAKKAFLSKLKGEKIKKNSKEH